MVWVGAWNSMRMSGRRGWTAGRKKGKWTRWVLSLSLVRQSSLISHVASWWLVLRARLCTCRSLPMVRRLMSGDRKWRPAIWSYGRLKVRCPSEMPIIGRRARVSWFLTTGPLRCRIDNCFGDCEVIGRRRLTRLSLIGEWCVVFSRNSITVHVGGWLKSINVRANLW